MFRLLYNFMFNNHEKCLTLYALSLSAYARVLLRFLPVSRLYPYLGEDGIETPEDPLNPEQRKRVSRIANRVNRVANRTPWESKCFVRALVAQRLMYRYGLASTLYLGVARDKGGKMVAHAWIRCGPLYVTGGNGQEYAVVARFAKHPRRLVTGQSF